MSVKLMGVGNSLMLGEGLRLVLGEPDASPVHGVFTKTELVTVEQDPVLANQCQVLGNLLEGALQVGGVQQRVVNDPLDIPDPYGDLVIPVSVGIPNRLVALGRTSVPVTPSFSIEGCQVPVFLPDPHTVISIPGIQDQFLGVVGHGHCLLEG